MLDCKYTFPIGLTPNGILIGSKSGPSSRNIIFFKVVPDIERIRIPFGVETNYRSRNIEDSSSGTELPMISNLVSDESPSENL